MLFLRVLSKIVSGEIVIELAFQKINFVITDSFDNFLLYFL